MYHVQRKLFILIVFVVLFMTLYILSDINYTMYENQEGPKIPPNLNLIISQEEATDEFSFPTEPFKEIIIHLDLKGAPPKVSFLLDFIPFVKKLGATGLLLEYEDMFPYYDELEDLKALNAYTLSDISLINKSAEENNLTVIPLVQTFGHLEFVLKLKKYESYREVDTNPQVLCPNQTNIINVVEKMISQVMDAHPRSKYFHMGCDEVGSLGACHRCRRNMKTNKWRKDDIYFLHVKRIAQYIIKKSPGVRPIIWGDQLNEKNEKIVLSHDIPELVDVMLWNYKSNPKKYPKANDMSSNARLFKSIWVASAFKGSSGKSKMVPIPLAHYTNNKGWMHFASQWKDKIRFKGIVVTGWQRYSHFSVLCELLPVAMPSLALSLQALTGTNDSTFVDFKEILQCNSTPPLTKEDVRDLKLLSKLGCGFLGFDIYYYIHLLDNKLNEAQKSLDVFKTEDLLLYNILSKFSEPSFIKELSGPNNFKNSVDDLNELEYKLRLALGQVYDEDTVTEWIMTHILPYQLRLEAAMKIFEDLSAQKTWPNRPFSNSESSVRDLFRRVCGPYERRGCAFLHIF